MSKETEKVLFGGETPWEASEWTASDDRVRGGKSQSYLTISDSSARFHGHLDIKTLGGAGFASQRTATDDQTWDLSSYDGVLLDLGKVDSKTYTFVIKDTLLPKNPEDGREQSTVSWEYDFTISGDAGQAESSFVYIPWKSLKATYRGKEKKDAGKLDTKTIKRFSLMMRSHFGNQHGDFSLNVKSIKAVSRSSDLEHGVVEGRGNWVVFRTPLLMSLLAFTALAYGLCVYVCPLVKGNHMLGQWHW